MASEPDEIAELRAQVAHLTRLVEELYARSGAVAPATAISIDAPPADILDALRAGQKITAIKRWRELSGVTLAEAKNEIDALATRLGL